MRNLDPGRPSTVSQMRKAGRPGPAPICNAQPARDPVFALRSLRPQHRDRIHPVTRRDGSAQAAFVRNGPTATAAWAMVTLGFNRFVARPVSNSLLLALSC
jgi:hypothetical protein